MRETTAFSLLIGHHHSVPIGETGDWVLFFIFFLVGKEKRKDAWLARQNGSQQAACYALPLTSANFRIICRVTTPARITIIIEKRRRKERTNGASREVKYSKETKERKEVSFK